MFDDIVKSPDSATPMKTGEIKTIGLAVSKKKSNVNRWMRFSTAKGYD